MNLYKDLQKVFQFQKVQKVPRWVLRGAKEQPICSGEQEKLQMKPIHPALILIKVYISFNKNMKRNY
jgi:hypothetical protein